VLVVKEPLAGRIMPLLSPHWFIDVTSG
jgi:hypothetical protein